jgi:hypothetical protein
MPAFGPDGSDFLTPRERNVLAEIAGDLRTSDRALAEHLTGDGMGDSLSTPPIWAIWMGRVGLISMPVTLLIPFEWWGALAALAAPVAAYMLLRARPIDGGLSGTRRNNP